MVPACLFWFHGFEVSVHYLTSDYLFTTPIGAPTVYFAVLTGFFVVLFLGSAFVYWRRSKLAGENPVLRRFIRRVSKAGMWTSGFGIFFCVMRYAAILYLAMPIWLDLVVLAMLATIGYFVYDLSERYPLAVWRLQEAHIERRYRPAARPRPEPQRARPKVRGKGRRR